MIILKASTSFQCNNRESKISATGTNDWSKTLNSSMYERLCVCSTKLLADHISSGNAILNSGENILIVDNLVNGFDIYKYPHTAPFNAIEVPRKTPFIHGASFIENGSQVACGSDHGIVYLYSVEKGERLQKLKHGSQTTMIQALDVSYFSHFFRFGRVDGVKSLSRQFRPMIIT